MYTVDIDETTEAGRDILRRIVQNPKAGRIREFEIPLDENGNSIGYTLDEVFADVDKMLSETYGVDFAKVNRMVELGELNDADVTDELLCSPAFAYKPYPGFERKPVSDNFKPEPWSLEVLSDE